MAPVIEITALPVDTTGSSSMAVVENSDTSGALWPSQASEVSSAADESKNGETPAPIADVSSTRAITRMGPTSNAAPSAAVQVPLSAPVPAPALPGSRWAAQGIGYVTEGQDWDAQSLANVDLALSRLPPRVLDQLGNRALGGIDILVNRSGRALSGKQPYSAAANFYSTNDGRNEVVLFPAQSPATVLHELGHAYNLRHVPPGRYALVVLQPEMQSFMTATRWRLLSSAAQVQTARDQTGLEFAYDGVFSWPRLSHNDPLEDFANSFSSYFSSPADLRAQSPERFAWFEANVGH